VAAKRIAIVLAVMTLLVAPGCAQRASQTTAPPPTAQADTSATPAPAPAPEEPATTQPAPAEPAGPAFPQNLDEFVHVPALKDVLFDPDRADIVRDGASIMMANARWIVARWLVDNRDYFVLIEGHTDTREAREDPLALCGATRQGRGAIPHGDGCARDSLVDHRLRREAAGVHRPVRRLCRQEPSRALPGQARLSAFLDSPFQNRIRMPPQPAIGAPGATNRSGAIGSAKALKFTAPAVS
jgi:hypothetical protein